MFPRSSLRLVIGALTLAFAAACGAAETSVSGDEAEVRSGGCALEIALVCEEGFFDGCLEPGLTRDHVCVADADRRGAAPCAQEIARICPAGQKDACLLQPAPSTQHVCVVDPAPLATPPAPPPAALPSSDEPPDARVTGCALEIAFVCPEGSFDGCSVPNLTTEHVCVAKDDGDGERLSCSYNLERECESGFRDACQAPAVAKTHLCVAK